GQKVNCHFEPGFLGLSICTDKLLKRIGDKISKKLTLKEKDSKFVREETTAPLGLAVISLTFTSNIKNNAQLNNKKFITIPTEVLVEKYNSKLPNYILLGNNWFYGHKYDDNELQIYIPEIVTNVWTRTTLRIKNLVNKKRRRVIVYVTKNNVDKFYEFTSSYSNSDTSDISGSSTSSSESDDKHVCKAGIYPK
ncbi:4382_t:CDS:1, partial [Dentiscutata erythropus]